MFRLILFSLLALCCVAGGAYEYKLFGESYTYTDSYKDSNSITYALRTSYDGSKYAVVVNTTKLVMRFAQSVTYQGKTYSVDAVADKTFEMLNVTEVYTGNSMMSIGNLAFEGCTDLTKVVLGSNVQYIGSGAFQNCKNLLNLEMGPNVISIGEYAFAGCPSLQYLELPSSITEIGVGAFYSTNSLKFIDWNLDPDKINAENLINVFLQETRTTTVVHTKTLKQAQEARKIFSHVYCEEEDGNTDALTYYKGLYNMKVGDDNKVLSHYNILNDCDVNQDGSINSVDIVTIYNRIINGPINKHNGYEYVDMGFPGNNNVLWASCNIGATTPECVGDYFAWGENVLLSYQTGTLFKKYGFTQANYLPPAPIKDLTTGDLPTAYQPTISRMGGKWRMPTEVEAVTLVMGCTRKEVTLNGVKCIEFTSKYNGNKLYFPMAGRIDGLEVSHKNEAWYWTSSADYYNKGGATQLSGYSTLAVDRYIGMPIRAVVEKKDVEE